MLGAEGQGARGPRGPRGAQNVWYHGKNICDYNVISHSWDIINHINYSSLVTKVI